MSLINTVRATVLSIANKNNFGYITPKDFNLYAKQAQLDIFEDYFYQYNSSVVKQNARVLGTGYADIMKGIEEVIDSFSDTKSLVKYSLSNYKLPEDYYVINKINYYSDLSKSGTVTSVTASKLDDSSANFITEGITVGSIVTNNETGFIAFVTAVLANQLSLSDDIFSTNGDSYSILVGSPNKIKEVERVSQNKIFYLNSSTLTQPTTMFPAYVLEGNNITVYPSLIQEGTIISQYIRYPKDPNWTYQNIISAGEPSFDETAADYQDFELPMADETNLVNKILQYAGVSIREVSLVQYAKGEENEATKQEG